MDALALTAEALREPWRLWTGHLIHFGWAHALPNALACAVPLLLLSPRDRAPALARLFLLAPLLSLLLLPGLGGGQYRGASGLACALWALAGLALIQRRESAATGALLLGGLALKVATEAALGTPLLARAAGWQALPLAHFGGSLLGLAAGLPRLRAAVPRRV